MGCESARMSTEGQSLSAIATNYSSLAPPKKGGVTVVGSCLTLPDPSMATQIAIATSKRLARRSDTPPRLPAA